MRTIRTLAVLAVVPLSGVCAVLRAPRLPAPVFADTEVSTNIVFDAGTPGRDKFAVVLELSAAADNNVQIAFGCDADGDGSLALHEQDAVVGWDCGAWFFRDRRGGAEGRAERPAGRNRLDCTILLDGAGRCSVFSAQDRYGPVFSQSGAPALFDPRWNMARVTARGACRPQEIVFARTSSRGLAVGIR